MAADITEGSGKALLKPREEPGLAALATGRIDQSAEAVQSPPVATSGCLGMFKRVKSEEVTIRGLSQPFLTAGMLPAYFPVFCSSAHEFCVHYAGHDASSA